VSPARRQAVTASLLGGRLGTGLLTLGALASVPAGVAAAPHPAPAAGLVDVRTVAPGVVVDLRYATTGNFLGEAVYPPDTACLLLDATARKLARVNEALAKRGYALKTWDCYRTSAAQQRFWEKLPDPRFVADPARGGSRHERGVAVDVTLVDREGREVPMPTGFDDFSERAARDWAGASPEVAAHRALLRQTMEAGGFRGIRTEWWHYEDPEQPPAANASTGKTAK